MASRQTSKLPQPKLYQTRTAAASASDGDGSDRGGRADKSEVDALMQRLQRLNEENDELLDKLSEARSFRERREREFEEERRELRERNDTLESGHYRFLADIERFKERLQYYETVEAEASELRERVKREQRNRIDLEKRLKEHQDLIGEQGEKSDDVASEESLRAHHLERQLSEMREAHSVAVASLQAKYKRLEEELDENLREMDDLKATNEELKAEVQENLGKKDSHGTEEELQVLQGRLDETEDMLRRALQERETVRQDFDRKSKEMQGEIVRLTGEIQERERELSELGQQVNEGRDIDGEHNDELLVVGNSMSRNSQSRNDRDNEVDDLRKALAERDMQLEELLAQVESKQLSNQNDPVIESEAASAEEIAHLRMEINQHRVKTEELEAINLEQQKCIEEKDNELRIAHESLIGFKEQLSKISANAATEESALKEMALLKDKLKKKDIKQNEMKDELERCTKDLQQLSADNARLKSEISTDNHKSGQAKQENDKKLRMTKEKLKNASNELEKCQNNLDKTRMELEEHRATIDKYEKKLEKYKTEPDDETPDVMASGIGAGGQLNAEKLRELSDKTGKLERALVRLKLENDDLRAGKTRKPDESIKRLLLEKESHIFDLQKEVTSLRQAITLQHQPRHNEHIHTDDLSHSPSDMNLIKHKYQDILTAHRKLLEETAGLRSAADRNSLHPNTASATEAPVKQRRGSFAAGRKPDAGEELLQTRKKLETTNERVQQLEKWLDEIYADPEMGHTSRLRKGLGGTAGGSAGDHANSLPELSKSGTITGSNNAAVTKRRSNKVTLTKLYSVPVRPAWNSST